MKKHTPGPWIVFDLGYGLGVCPESVTEALIPNVAASHNAICRIKPPRCHADNFDLEFEQQKADAKLIAAAPEMLAALRAIRDRDTEDSEGYDKAFELVINSIIKAEGDDK